MTPLYKEEDQTATALIQKDLSYIQKDICEIKVAIKGLNSVYATKEQLSETTIQTEKRLVILEKTSNFWKWFTPTITAVFGSILTYLFLFYLQNIK